MANAEAADTQIESLARDAGDVARVTIKRGQGHIKMQWVTGPVSTLDTLGVMDRIDPQPSGAVPVRRGPHPVETFGGEDADRHL